MRPAATRPPVAKIRSNVLRFIRMFPPWVGPRSGPCARMIGRRGGSASEHEVVRTRDVRPGRVSTGTGPHVGVAARLGVRAGGNRVGEFSECGQRLVPNARFCASCGTAVAGAATSRPGFSGGSVSTPPPVPPAYPGGYVAPYPPTAPYPEPRRGTNGYAIASLVLSIVMMCGIGSIL